MALASSLRCALKVNVRAALASAASPAPRFCQPAFLGSLRACSDVKFTKTHEWLGQDGDVHVMGISKFAANALGEVVYADLPSEGATFDPKDTICTLESVKAVGEVYAPAACEVVEVNEKLSEEPATINSDSEGGGWLLRLKITGSLPGDVMDRAAYDKMCEAESTE